MKESAEAISRTTAWISGMQRLIFENPVIEAEDTRAEYGETRYRASGHMDGDYFMGAFT